MNKFKTSEDAFLNAGDLSLFIAQLALMLRCGLPLAKALDILGDSGDPNFETVSEKLVFEMPAQLLQLPARLRSKIRMMTFPDIAISSSEVRSRIQEGRPVRFLIPEPVYRIITVSRLYKKTSTSAE